MRLDIALNCPYSTDIRRVGFCGGEGFDGLPVHFRNVLPQLSELLRCAGVFAGLDSKAENRNQATHPPKACGFLSAVVSN